MNCKNCKKQGCFLAGKNHEMSFECNLYVGKTNADRIRGMTDEELAEFMIGVLCYTKLPYIEVREKALRDNELLDWLKEETDHD